MSTQFLRPTGPGQNKRNRAWKLRGPWGERVFPASSKVVLYERLRDELLASGVLSSETSPPSNNHHEHVTLLIMESSWIGDRWMRDAAEGTGSVASR
jgi:hypothetical protein